MINGLTHRDQRWCVLLQRATSRQRLSRLLGVASVLGNGIAWYLLMLAMATTGGRGGRRSALIMLATAALTFLLYRGLKAAVARPRPFEQVEGLRPRVAPLDRWSFPSGHTTHAVAFTMVAGQTYPGLLWVLLPFTLLVMVSRVALGLHYPSDVAAGALCGYVGARICLEMAENIFPL